MDKKLCCLVLIFLLIFTSGVSVSAHDSNLGVPGHENCYYDECVGSHYVNSFDIGDGIDERWYELIWGNVDTSTTPNTFNSYAMYHIDDDIMTLYYKFEEFGLSQSSTTWYTGVGVENGNAIIEAYESSMLKWNEIYFYKQNGSLYEKYKIVNLVNYDSLSNKQGVIPNIYIYPYYSQGNFSAQTSWIYETELINERVDVDGINHRHFTQFNMEVNLYYLNNSENFKIRTGAHEVGHVLGLFDIDTIENPKQSSNFHHEEILMGYAKNNDGNTRQSEITYKDIAGVAITRGLHTDANHKWMTDGINTTSGIKLICSICNCIKYVNSLNEYEYVQFGFCGNNHTLSSNNMMPVASFGNKDYYKCKYCRYVAPFTTNVTQNYSYVLLDGEKHMVSNNISGLYYNFTEEHTSSMKCNKCDYMHAHNFNRWVYYSNIAHIEACDCLAMGVVTRPHVVRLSEIINNKAICLECGRLMDLNRDLANVYSINIEYSVNGSYILPNGVLILVDEDVDSYFAGTLRFYKKDETLELR